MLPGLPTASQNGSVLRSSVVRNSKARIVLLDKNSWDDDASQGSSRSSFQAELDTGVAFIQDDWQPKTQANCTPKADWQVQSNPNCNSIHEISMPGTNEDEALTILGEGWFRTTWRWGKTVLKTLRIERDFLSEYYELHRRDAVAMERLTSSPFVVNIYGYCGQSAVNELADFPFPGIQNLEAFNKRMRGNNSPKASSIKLRMAASIALGLADIHAGGESTEENSNVMMTHYDLNPRNIALFAGGKPKINDFNIAEFMQVNRATNETCPFPSRLHEPWWRAPEEMDTTHKSMVNEKVDVYALGNILYHTLTTHSSRGAQKKERMDHVRPLVAAGVQPIIPRQYTDSSDPSVQAMISAIHLCWAKDSSERASAAEVAQVLYDALAALSGAEDKNDTGGEQEANQRNESPGAGEQGDDEVSDNTMEDKKALTRIGA